MHFAAYALVPESMRDPSKYFRNNISNGLNLLDAMVAAGVQRIIFSSTCAIFGPPERVPIDETTIPRPISPYGESKLAFEKILRWYDQIHGVKFVSLRYFNASGATENFGEDHRPETHLIPTVLKVALGQSANVEIYGTDYETSARLKSHADLATRRGLSLPRKKSKKSLVGNHSSSHWMLSSRARGRGIRSFHMATTSKN